MSKIDACCEIVAIAFTVLFIVGFIVRFYVGIPLALEPTPPEFRVEAVKATTPINFANSTFSTGLDIGFWIGNPNNGIIYEHANVSVYYHNNLKVSKRLVHGEDYYLSSSTLDSLCPRGPCGYDDDQSWLNVNVTASSVPVSDKLTALAVEADLEKGGLSLTIKLEGDYRQWRSTESPSKLRVECKNIKMEVPAGVMVGGPRTCKVHWSADRLYGV